MSKKKKVWLSISIAFLCAAILGKAAQVLDSGKHPLVSSLTCIETEDPADFYWSLNQIAISGVVDASGKRVVLTLRNTIPNFESYFYRIDGTGQWQRSDDGRIVLEAGEGSHTLDLKATNTMGGEVPAGMRVIKVSGQVVTVLPDAGTIERDRYAFRFEKPGSEKILWLSERIRPVIADCRDQWNTFIVLRSWVKEQIPNRHPSIKSRWDAQRILQAVWNDPSLGFICDAHAATYVSACVSVGLNARMIHLGDDNYNGHYATEVWSDEHNKWIFMDPLYDRHFSAAKTPLSALELHNLWKEGTIAAVTTHATGGVTAASAAPAGDYVNLFQDIQLVNANDFLTAPFTSVLDIVTLKIRFLRYIDETNPPYDRMKAAGRIVLFYYLPILITGAIIPFGIPAYLIFMIMQVGKKEN